MKVLVSAASRHGATAGIAERIAKTLAANGHEPSVVPPERVASLDGYDAVVLGSAVYMGRWLEPARRLAERESQGLRARRVWAFSSGPIGDPPMPKEPPADVAALQETMAAREHRVFAGRLEKSGLGFGERAIAAVLRAPSGDYRPWSEVDAWAAGIARELGAA